MQPWSVRSSNFWMLLRGLGPWHFQSCLCCWRMRVEGVHQGIELPSPRLCPRWSRTCRCSAWWLPATVGNKPKSNNSVNYMRETWRNRNLIEGIPRLCSLDLSLRLLHHLPGKEAPAITNSACLPEKGNQCFRQAQAIRWSTQKLASLGNQQHLHKMIQWVNQCQIWPMQT